MAPFGGTRDDGKFGAVRVPFVGAHRPQSLLLKSKLAPGSLCPGRLGHYASLVGDRHSATGTNSLQTSKEGLEIEKLQPEVAKLKNDRFKVGSIVPAILGVVGIGFTIIATFIVTRLTLHGALDQSVHDKRLESYPGLWNATASLALYFPSDDPPPVSTGPRDCRVIGRAISKWYFGGGGLLLSVDARDAYFRLARALTRASAVEELRVPIFPMDAEEISQEKVSEYREKLRGGSVSSIMLRFGPSVTRIGPSETLYRNRKMRIGFGTSSSFSISAATFGPS